jgi:serine/threonine protein kinase/WD40 repeat protein
LNYDPMMNEPPCPDASSLERFLLGKSSGAEAAALDQHLQDCERCLAVVQSLPSDDSLVDALQAGSSKAEMTGPEGVQLLAAWLKKRRLDFDPRATRSPGPAGPSPGADSTDENGKTGELDDTLDLEFLAPRQHPDELGWLGQYQVRKVLGAGGMGIVFEAFDPGLERQVALKTILPALAAQSGAKQRFLREAKAAARIKHEHIVTIYQVGEDRGMCFLAMEYLQGESLERRLARETILPLAETLRISRECAQALAAAHAQGLIHRDIKPANIWLEGKEADDSRKAESPAPLSSSFLLPPPSFQKVKILDFGLALPVADNAHLTQAGALVGTPAYMAPEQMRGQPLDARADLFSLGCVLYRMATGQAPFQGTHVVSTLIAIVTTDPVPPQQLNPCLPKALCDLIAQLLLKAPAGRPDSALAVVEAIRAIEQTATTPNLSAGPSAPAVPILSPATPAQQTPPATRRRGPMVLGVAAALVVGVFAVPVCWWLNHGQPEEPGAPTLPPPAPRRGSGQDQVIELRRLAGEKSQVWTVVLSGDGSRALSAHRDSGEVVLWDVATGAILRKMRHGHPDVHAVAFGPDGSWAISGGLDRVVRIWDLESGQERRQTTLPYNVTKLAMFRDGKRVLFGNKALRVLELDPFKITSLEANQIGPLAIALSPDNKLALAGSGSGKIGLWNVETGKALHTFKHGHTKQIRWLDFSPDGTRAVSASTDGKCRIWDVASGEPRQVFAKHTDQVCRAVFFPDGRHVVSIGWDKYARIWDSRTAREIHAIFLAAPGRTLALSADGRLLLTGYGDPDGGDVADSHLCAWRLPPMPTHAPAEPATSGP